MSPTITFITAPPSISSRSRNPTSTSTFISKTSLKSVKPVSTKRSTVPCAHLSNEPVTILDYGAGNVRSLENAVKLFTSNIQWAKTPQDILSAKKLIFPGVGSFGAAMNNLHNQNFANALTTYLKQDRPFLGICLGLHTLFEASEESPDVPGLAILPGTIKKFQLDNLSVPHIGWNSIVQKKQSLLLNGDDLQKQRYYFVHSYRVGMDIADNIPEAVLATTTHGEEYMSILQLGRLCATQFHPEKSGAAGLTLIRNFIQSDDISKVIPLSSSTTTATDLASEKIVDSTTQGLAKRVVACLDVRENDSGDLVVTKGDQYDVRETQSGNVRNLGKPVDLAHRYFEEGADEITFLNITSFRGQPIGCTPMIEVLEKSSSRIFVPLTIGGGIRDYTDEEGNSYTALDVATMYFRAGADKVSLGSDAVYAAEKYIETNEMDGTSSIEMISKVYGAQAVVVSIDPRKVYVEKDEDTKHTTVLLKNGKRCWYQCTVKGGREGRDIDVVELAKAVEILGAGEILLNSMDQDGQNQGYDHSLIELVKNAVTIPVIASSGAGKEEHFTDCFDETDVEAALAAGIFHRKEVSIQQVKEHMMKHGTAVRIGTSLQEVLEEKSLV